MWSGSGIEGHSDALRAYARHFLECGTWSSRFVVSEFIVVCVELIGNIPLASYIAATLI